jgi:hypothetical protein
MGGMIFMIVRSCRQLEARRGIASVELTDNGRSPVPVVGVSAGR